MTSQTRTPTITINILPDTSKSKGNQTMKFSQLIVWNVRNMLPQQSCMKRGREISSMPLFVFKKALFKMKARGQDLSFNIFWYPSTWTYNKNKLYETSDCWSRDMLNFDFLKKSLGLVSPRDFVHDFSRKTFLILYSVNWSNFIVWLPFLLEISGNLCIVIVCYSVCDVLNFEINVNFLNKPASCKTKNLERKSKYFENRKRFSGEIKNIFKPF